MIDLSAIGVQNYTSFVVAVIGFLLVPGPGNLTLINATSHGGFLAGLAATIGVIVGDQLLLWAAIAGVASLLLAHPMAFAAVKWIGAAYLIWVGVRLFMAKPEGDIKTEPTMHHFARHAIAITLTNPKAIVFYMAFLPQFLDPARVQGAAAYLFLAASLAVITFIYGLIMVSLAHKLVRRLSSHPGVGQLMKKCMGSFLIVFGISLANRA